MSIFGGIFGTLLFMLMPLIVWVIIVAAIVMAINGNFRRRSKGRTANRSGRVNPTIDLGSNRRSGKKSPDIGFGKKGERPIFSFGKSGYDKYPTRSRKKDFVGGYDKKFTDEREYRRARGQQYGHTYDGHEPWDKCLPKEKDPWDKDFYA